MNLFEEVYFVHAELLVRRYNVNQEHVSSPGWTFSVLFLHGELFWGGYFYSSWCHGLAEPFLFFVHGELFLRRYNVRRLITWAWWECAKGRGDQWSPKTRRQTPPSPYLHKNTKNTEKGKIQQIWMQKKITLKAGRGCNLKLVEWQDARIHRGLYAHIL